MHRVFAVNSLPGTRTHHFERQRAVDRNDVIGTHLRMEVCSRRCQPS